jgi:hypothetical protein
MLNYKQKYNLIGAENWSSLSTIFVKGISGEQDVSSDNTDEGNEKIIQSWKNVAVLRATSEQPTSFNLGFYNQAYIGYLKHGLKTNLEFGVRIGPGDVNFFVFPIDMQTPVKLELVERTTEDDTKYAELILI